jgi:hypothetical protein
MGEFFNLGYAKKLEQLHWWMRDFEAGGVVPVTKKQVVMKERVVV